MNESSISLLFSGEQPWNGQ